MREILFRGKRVDNGEWVEGYYCVFEDLHQIFVPYTEKEKELYKGHIFEHSSGTWQIVIPETVGEYTGLTDKNGKKIFEGDIIKCVALVNDHSQKGTKAVSVVENYMGNTCLRLDGKYLTGVTLYTISVDHLIEVIGNIHDNPELLGGGEDA